VGRPGNLQEEARLGVPTGGGWHEIGRAPQGAGPNFGESVINSLENEPILMGFAVQQPGPTPTGVEKYAFGLTDVATVRWLFPGEAMVTMIGDSPWGYLRGKPPEVKHNFHWFLFQQDREVCTEEWVHPCEPTAADPLGFACLARAT
jgi:hypothetical protein